MNLQLYSDAALTTDFPELGLRRGDIVKVVDELTGRDRSRGYAVEVFDAIGETIDVHMLPATALEPLRHDEMLCVRPRTVSAA